MANSYYTHTTYPATNSAGSSAGMRAELDAIMAAFSLLPNPLGSGQQGFNGGQWNNPIIVGGSIDNAPIGQSTPLPGSFTTLTAAGAAAFSSTLGVTGATTLSSTLGVAGAAAFAGVLGVVGAATFGSTITGNDNASLFKDAGSLFMRATSAANLNAWRLTWGQSGAADGAFTIQHSTDNFAANFLNALSFTAGGVGSFSSRPSFAGNTPWDSGNLSPMTLDTVQTVTGAKTFSSRPVFNGNTPWDTGNLNFATPPAIGGTTPNSGRFTGVTSTSGVTAAGTVQSGPGPGSATSYVTTTAIFATKTGNTSSTDQYTEMWNDGTTGGIWLNMGSAALSKGLITATASQVNSGVAKIFGRSAPVLTAHWSGNSATPNSPQAALGATAVWLSTGRLRIWLTEAFAFATHAICVNGQSLSNGTNWLVVEMQGNDGGGAWIDIGFTITGTGGGSMIEGQFQCTVFRVN